jgi:thiamine-monophosphate kinase
VIGSDYVRGPKFALYEMGLLLSGTAIGLADQGKVLTRNGARTGDLLYVTGPCGMPGAAVAYFPKREARGWELPTETERELIEGWRRPKARVAEGRILSNKPFATACQDTSDGLKATIEQLANASDVGFDVVAGSVPVESTVTDVAALMGVDALFGRTGSHQHEARSWRGMADDR